MMVNLVVYDLDGTLTKKDTMISFTQFTHGKFKSFLNFILLSPLIILSFMGFLDRQSIKELVLKIHYKGISESKIRDLGKKFSNEIMSSILNASIYSGMKRHLENGTKVIVLSASCDVWVEPWCISQGIEFIGSRMEFRDNVCTGRLVGKNVRGEEKFKLLKKFLKTNSYICEEAYGNEKSDLLFMNLAKTQYYVINGNLKQI